MLQFFPGNRGTRIRQKNAQDLKWLRLELDPNASFAYFAGAKVNVVGAEANDGFSWIYVTHDQAGVSSSLAPPITTLQELAHPNFQTPNPCEIRDLNGYPKMCACALTW